MKTSKSNRIKFVSFVDDTSLWVWTSSCSVKMSFLVDSVASRLHTRNAFTQYSNISNMQMTNRVWALNATIVRRLLNGLFCFLASNRHCDVRMLFSLDTWRQNISERILVSRGCIFTDSDCAIINRPTYVIYNAHKHTLKH